MNNAINYPYASGVYQGFIKSLSYNPYIPGMETIDRAKFEAFIESELERMNKNIQEYSQQST
jgi:hypothetical protein